MKLLVVGLLTYSLYVTLMVNVKGIAKSIDNDSLIIPFFLTVLSAIIIFISMILVLKIQTCSL